MDIRDYVTDLTDLTNQKMDYVAHIQDILTPKGIFNCITGS